MSTEWMRRLMTAAMLTFLLLACQKVSQQSFPAGEPTEPSATINQP